MQANHVRSGVLAVGLLLAFLVCVPSESQSLAGLALGSGPERNVARSAAPAADPLSGEGFTYQGRLEKNGRPVDDTCDMGFELWETAEGGFQLGETLTRTGVEIRNGLFTVGDLDFHVLFGGNIFWLQIAVKCSGDSDYTTLVPRQPLTAVPVASSFTVPVYEPGNADGPLLSLENFGTGDGVKVQVSGTGFRVSSGGPGLWAYSSSDGVYVLGAGDDGVHVYEAGSPSTWISSPNPDGFEVEGAENDGLYIGRADYDGVHVQSAGVHGVRVYASGEDGLHVWEPGRDGLRVYSAGADGVHVMAAGGYAGNFVGNVRVTGTLSKGAGSFTIDHPLDPENQYLQHSFVESPDMMNVYNGNVQLDVNGEAWVTLPDWFEALNRDFRYQLTPVGGPGPGLYVAQEVQDNRFQIAGGTSGLKVSWQVTGIRHDPYAKANRIVVEVDKPDDERGTYLHPEAYGLPQSRGLAYQEAPQDLAQQQAETGRRP
jgi:hypothetical protein